MTSVFQGETCAWSFLGFFFIYYLDGKAGMNEHVFSDLGGTVDDLEADLPHRATDVRLRPGAVYLLNQCRYGQTHLPIPLLILAHGRPGNHDLAEADAAIIGGHELVDDNIKA